MSEGYRISILRKAVRDKLLALNPDREMNRCSKVWEGQRCILRAPHNDKECIIAPPDDPCSTSAEGK